jgi:phosphatidate phosphatase PAH1
MKIFKTKSVDVKEKLEAKGLECSKDAEGHFVFELEEDVIVESIVNPLVAPKASKSSGKKTSGKKSSKKKKK